MVASRVSPRVLRALPAVLLAALAAWALADAVQLPAQGPAQVLVVLVGIAMVAGIGGIVRPAPFLRRFAPLLLLAVYVAAHVGYLGLDLVPALLFLTLAIASVPVRSLAERFGTVVGMDLPDDVRARVRGALLRASARVAVACVLSVAVPVVAADLALAGTLPSTSIPTAVVLAGGVIAVALLLALLPTLERRSA